MTAAQAEAQAAAKRPSDSYVSAVETTSDESGISKEDLIAIFELADFNGDDDIDKHELSGALKSIGLIDRMERAIKVSLIMSVLDSNKDGVVSRAEFMNLDRVQFNDFLAALSNISEEDGIQGMLEDIWDARFPADAEITEKELRTLLQVYGSLSVEESIGEAQKLMDELDVRGNDMLSREEFASEKGRSELPRRFSNTHLKSTRRGSVIEQSVERARVTREATEESFEEGGGQNEHRSTTLKRQRKREESTVLQEALAMKESGEAFQDMAGERIRHMHALFDLLDTDGSETIGFDEFKHILKDESITGVSIGHASDVYFENLFSQFDEDESGVLEFSEFLSAFDGVQDESGAKAGLVSQTFAQADHDALVQETEALQNQMKSMEANLKKEVYAHKELGEEMEAQMAQQASNFDDELSRHTTTESNLRRRVSTTASSLKEASHLLDTQEEQLDTIRNENDRLRKALAKANEHTSSDIGTFGGARSVEEVTVDNDDGGELDKYMTLSKKHSSTIARLQQKIQELEDENFELRETMTKAVPENVAETVANMIADADAKAAKASEAIEELEGKLVASEEKCENLEANFGQVSAPNAIVNAATSTSTNVALAEVTALVEDLQEKLTTSEFKLEENNVQLAAYETKNTELQAEVARLGKVPTPNAIVNAATSSSTNATLAESPAVANAVEATLAIATAESQLAKATAIASTLQVNLEHVETLNANLKEDLRVAEASASATEVDLFKEQESRASLEIQLQDAIGRTTTTLSEQQATEARCIQFQIRVTELEARNTQLGNELAVVRDDEFVGREEADKLARSLQTSSAAIQAVENDLAQNKSDLDTEKFANAELQTILSYDKQNFEDQIGKLTAQLNLLNDRQTQSAVAGSKLDNENKRLAAALAESRGVQDKLTAQLKAQDGKAGEAAVRAHEAELKYSTFEHENEMLRKRITEQSDEARRLQLDSTQMKGMAVRVKELEDENLKVRNAAYIDEQEIKRLVKALEESKASLDIELDRMERSQSFETSTSSPEQLMPEGVWSTIPEHAGLTKALEDSAGALKDAQDALRRSSDEIQDLQTIVNTIQAKLADAITNGGDVDALKAQLRIIQSQLAETLSRCTILENDLADALAELEKSRNAANRDNQEALIASLQREVDALTAERDAALAREQICQSELDHLRQRRNVSASAAYTDLLESNENLLGQVEALEEALRQAGDGGEQDELIGALVREIASLKEKGEHEHAARIASLERRLDREGRCRGGCNGGSDGNVTQEVRLVGQGANGQPRTPHVKKRIFHRRFFLPQGQQLTEATSQQGPSRMNVMVKVNKIPGQMANRNIVGKQAWFRLGQKRIGLVDGNNKAICAWLTTAVQDLKLTNKKTISFLANGELVSVTCKHPQLAEKAYAGLQNILPN